MGIGLDFLGVLIFDFDIEIFIYYLLLSFFKMERPNLNHLNHPNADGHECDCEGDFKKQIVSKWWRKWNAGYITEAFERILQCVLFLGVKSVVPLLFYFIAKKKIILFYFFESLKNISIDPAKLIAILTLTIEETINPLGRFYPKIESNKCDRFKRL